MRGFLKTLGGAIWRLQLLASFAFLTIYTWLAVLVVNGALFLSGQGKEILLDYWGATFAQDPLQLCSSWPRLYLLLLTMYLFLAVWSSARLLCDSPAKRTLSGFTRIRADNDAATFIRRAGPLFTALIAAVPLLLILVVDWSEEVVTVTMAPSHAHQVMFDRATSALGYLALAFILSFLFLHDHFERCRQKLAGWIGYSNPSGWRRRARSIIFWASVLGSAMLLWYLPGQPFNREATSEAIHGLGSIYYVGLQEWLLLPLALTLAAAYRTRRALQSLLAPGPSPTAGEWRRGHVFVFAMMYLVSLLAVAWLWAAPVEAAQRLGTVALLVFVSSFWSMSLSLVLVIAPARMGGPSLAALPLLLFLLFGSSVDQHELRTVATPPNPRELFAGEGARLQSCMEKERLDADQSLDADLLVWISGRIPPGGGGAAQLTVPLVVVAASGGGVRAAEFTAKALYALDAMTEGKFGQHVFASSTVSGASLGVAVWVKAQKTKDSWGAIDKFFTRDYFSPVAGGMLLHDAAQRLIPVPLPGPNRAQTLEDSWESGWRWSVEKAGGSSAPAAVFGNLSELKSQGPPLIIFNATEVHTGRRFLVSPARLSQAWFPDAYLAISRCSLHGTQDMSLAAAVHLSARFTFLSPAASIVGSPDKWAWEAYRKDREQSYGKEVEVPKMLWGQVVDGGYVENYGATTALELVQAIRDSWLRLRSQRLVSSNVSLHVMGLSLVNDPFDLGNEPLDRVSEITKNDWDLSGGDINRIEMKEFKERRFDENWPVAGSYDVRELRATMGTTTSIRHLADRSMIATELQAPIATVLHTREARGKAAERMLGVVLDNLKSSSPIGSGISGSWSDVRLGRLLRDRSAPDLQHPHLNPQSPSLGFGENASPNPQLAWYLSHRSRHSLWESLVADQEIPGRYNDKRDMARASNEFRKACIKNPMCSW